MKTNKYHCCATCVNFKPLKTEQGMYYYCSRLGYETKPDYTFNCWEPKPHIVELMKKEENKKTD
ncbi:hypothetical protein [Fictibacillus phosphorivorans]|uniref:hypothetical protein n=1 Tax=Fictibacillus phosphorivorans TaxID=1221500 RepID=UPI00203D6693|nr:hypothetical protein [Fictibacillus phosphorivorans]MCM3717617.1 hypothetical protein [Fictibacillus phosphorivorans]MCM3775517.1 hypothetical protein [Fictibacillus phosphorivorans]